MNQSLFETIKAKSPVFFLGANAPGGFVNYFSQCYLPDKGEKLYIIKGGPGTGKSSFMKQLVLFMNEHGVSCELYYCSSDPDSLDGVRFPGLGIAIVDGTSPHAMEPKMYGISEEIVNLGAFLDCETLNRGEIIPLYREHALLHKKAARYLTATGKLFDDSFAVVCEFADMEKAERTALRICKEYLPVRPEKGRETKRFLSGVSPQGHVFFEDTLCCFADRVFGIEDEYGGVASVMMSCIREYVLNAGYDTITCICPMAPQRKIDHIILPQIRIAFCTTNRFMPVTVDTERRIHASQFIDRCGLSKYKQRLRFNRRAAEELMDGACHHLQEAKKVHDCLEKYYIGAMDFCEVDRYFPLFTEELLKRL